ncbi:MAG TPA: GNAT family N-acetyltransferase, partial [Anaeromyxobacter sp.]
PRHFFEKFSAMWTIREAHPQDGDLLSEIAHTTFRDTFGPDNTAADMDVHCSRFFTPEAQTRELSDPSMRTLVVPGAEAGAPFAAYAQLRRGPAPPCVRAASPIELQRFYVRASLHGSGLARELMSAVIDLAAREGADTLWLGVWEKNPRAIRFYAKFGFREVGDQTFVLGSDPQRDLVMTRWLTGSDL